MALNTILKKRYSEYLKTRLLSQLTHSALFRLLAIIRLSFYDYLSKHPYKGWSQIWDFAPLLLLYLSTFLFFNHFVGRPTENFGAILALGLCSWNFFRESTSQASSIYGQKWKLIKNVPISKLKLHTALTLSSFYSFCLNFIILVVLSSILFSLSSFNLLKLIMGLGGLFFTTLMINLIVAPLCAIYRDGYQLWSIFLQVFIWANPVFLSSDILVDLYQKLLRVNPLGNFILIIYHSFGLATQFHVQYESLITLLILVFAAIHMTVRRKKNVIINI